MVGGKAMLGDLVFPVIFAVLLLVSVAAVIRPGKPKARIAAAVGVLVFSIWAALGFVTFYRHRHWVSVTAENLPAGMASVQVGDESYSNPTDLEVIAAALRQALYFSPSHGGWAKETKLVVVSNSGTTQKLRVARYLRQPGAVLIFSHESGNGTWIDGYAFVPGLASALDRLGAPLPKEP